MTVKNTTNTWGGYTLPDGFRIDEDPISSAIWVVYAADPSRKRARVSSIQMAKDGTKESLDAAVAEIQAKLDAEATEKAREEEQIRQMRDMRK